MYKCRLLLAKQRTKEVLQASELPPSRLEGICGGMTGSRALFIDDVLHKAFVSVNEAGTEATATAVMMKLTAMPGMPIEVTVNRSFTFLIRDIETGTILFVGRVLNSNR